MPCLRALAVRLAVCVCVCDYVCVCALLPVGGRGVSIGFDIAISSDVPLGSGLSSSAALEVGDDAGCV